MRVAFLVFLAPEAARARRLATWAASPPKRNSDTLATALRYKVEQRFIQKDLKEYSHLTASKKELVL